MMPTLEAVLRLVRKSKRNLQRGALVALLAHQSGVATAANYRIDPQQTTSSFEVWMLGFIPIRGHFRRTTGAMRFDPGNQVGNIEVQIDTTGVEASSGRALAAVRGPDFFNVDKYPRMDFKSSRFIFDGDQLHSIHGMLTLTGIIQPVLLAVDHVNCKAATLGDASPCRAEATLTVRRSAFGMKAWSHSISDDVTIRIAIVAVPESEVSKAPPATLTPAIGTGAAAARQ